MSFSITDLYNPKNNYSYREKSSFTSFLDVLSVPCRSLLGGRRVDVLSQTISPPMSTIGKVVLVASTFLLGCAMPNLIGSLALISSFSLLIKLATSSCRCEAEIVKNQSLETLEVLEVLEQADLKGNSDEVIRIFKAHPEIRPKNSVWEKFDRAVRSKIDSGASWGEIEEKLHFFSDDRGVDLVHYAVEKRFTSELEKNWISTTAGETFLFVIRALKGNREQAKKCYAKMFSTFLKLKEADDLITKVMKLGLANQMIELLCIGPARERSLMRLSLFPENDFDRELRTIAQDDEKMKSISESVENLSRINFSGSECLDRLSLLNLPEAVTASCSKQWKGINYTIECFKRDLKYRLSRNSEEQIYISFLEKTSKRMDQFIKNLQKASLLSVEILDLIRTEETNLESEAQKLLEFTFLKEIAHSTPLENVLHVLHQKKRENIFIIIEKINNKLLQFVNKRMKERCVSNAS